MENKKGKVFVTWFMEDYGASYMGICASFILEKTDNPISEYSLFKKWETAKEKVKIHCLFPKYFEGGKRDEKVKNVEQDKQLKALKQKNSGSYLESIDFWEFCRLIPFDDQIAWFEKYWGKNYKTEKLNICKDNKNDLNIILKEVKKTIHKIAEDNKEADVIINFHNTPTEFQIACYILATEPYFPKNIKFYKFFDVNKDAENNKLGDTTRIELSNTPLTDYYEIEKPFNHPKEKKIFDILDYFVNQQKNLFTILLIGERGTGKTKLVEALRNKNIVSENCAYFPDNNFTESKLFGAKKGAYTGCDKDIDGAFKLANEGILFLDEIHHLDKKAQAKLLTSLQTNERGEFTYKRMGDSKEEISKFQLICATNRTLDELKQSLHSDFFDRISQRIINIPNINELGNKEELFQEVWRKMKFDTSIENIPEVDRKKYLLG